ncbi:MAG TPA: S9 family peptidase [Thermoanaerobaculia bacterium]|nr:S9 family peptidase [Thermoanaerobaculia bacterium]
MSRFPFADRLAPVLAAVAALAVLAAAVPAQPAEDDGPRAEVAVEQWLVAGPVVSALPAFAADTGLGVPEELTAADLLPAAGELGADDRVWPAAGAERVWASGEATRWTARGAGDGTLALDAGDGERPRVAWLAAYVDADRFLAPTLTVSSAHPLRVFLDGEEVGSGEGAGGAGEEGEDEEDGDEEDGDEEDEDADAGDEATGEDEALDDEPTELADDPSPRDGEEDGEEEGADEGDEAADDEEPESTPVEATLSLPTGKHLLLVVTVFDPDAGAPWEVEATLSLPEERRADVALSTSPERGVAIGDLLDLPAIQGAAASADGELVAITLARPAVPAEDRSQWVEIVRAADGAPVDALRFPGSVSGFAWAPEGRAYAYRTAGGEGRSTLWVGDLAAGTVEPLLEAVEGLSSHRWAPDARSLFVVISEEEEDDERGAVRVRSLPDRWAGSRQRGYLWQVSRADGARRRLTGGVRPGDLLDVAPDGSRLLLARTDYTLERPFTVGELVELDLATLAPRTVAKVPWLGGAAYSPDGSRLLVVAGPSAFGEIGQDVPAGTIPNEYDNQLYLLDRDGGGARSLTRDFDPAVGQAEWSRHDGRIYFQAADRTFGRIYRLDPTSGRIEEVATGIDVVSGLSLADDAATLAYWGSSLQEPEKVFAIAAPGAGRAASRVLLDPAADAFEQVRFGRVEDFDFTTGDGTTIEGRLYYPLEFDPAKKYPLLVYYYGGVVPTDRSFGGRYPKNLWAAQGYAVYVLQPSGAVGWGQGFSARHVNDWGRRVSGEIQQGVREVLAAHPFLDASAVGNFGGSYGGFMTMLLLTESDQFAAAISHAGISAIPSYWGEGWWGFLYNAVSAAGSYPWNRPDVYVEQSPLFAAEEIDTPLLLLHGTADPNVPPGESDQMFAALRVLGKEVEYIRIEGEEHWILTYPKRVLWWQTILAWFDLHLKDQPEWWEELWGEPVSRSGP